MPPITSRTTTEEVQAIVAEYTEPGGIRYERLADAIQAWTPANSSHDYDDLLTAYYLGTGNLPSFMSLPGAIIPPDEVIDVLETVQELAVSHPNDAQELNDFAQLIEDRLGPVGLAQAYLEEYADDLEDDPELLDLFRPEDLREVISLFLRMGNPGLALLLYVANGRGIVTQEIQDAALEAMEYLEGDREDILDEIEGVDSTDENAQSEIQRLNAQLQRIDSMVQVLIQIIQNVQETDNTMVQAASNIMASTGRTEDTIVGNMRS